MAFPFWLQQSSTCVTEKDCAEDDGKVRCRSEGHHAGVGGFHSPKVEG